MVVPLPHSLLLEGRYYYYFYYYYYSALIISILCRDHHTTQNSRDTGVQHMTVMLMPWAYVCWPSGTTAPSAVCCCSVCRVLLLSLQAKPASTASLPKEERLYSTCASPVDPHLSTRHAHGCIASEIGRDPTFSNQV